MAKSKITFPCGMIFELRTIHFTFNEEELKLIYDKGCPIHGRDCKNIILRQVEEIKTKPMEAQKR